jgi:hypothetical protein
MMTWTLLLALATQGAQEPTSEELAARRARKLEAPFLKAAPWTTDYEAALKQAAEKKLPVFAYFTRSFFD